MNAMIQRIADVLKQDAPCRVEYNSTTNQWYVYVNSCTHEVWSTAELAEDRCEQLNREWMAREIVKAMKAPVCAIDYVERYMSKCNLGIWEMFIEAILNDEH